MDVRPSASTTVIGRSRPAPTSVVLQRISVWLSVIPVLQGIWASHGAGEGHRRLETRRMASSETTPSSFVRSHLEGGVSHRPNQRPGGLPGVNQEPCPSSAVCGRRPCRRSETLWSEPSIPGGTAGWPFQSPRSFLERAPHRIWPAPNDFSCTGRRGTKAEGSTSSLATRTGRSTRRGRSSPAQTRTMSRSGGKSFDRGIRLIGAVAPVA